MNNDFTPTRFRGEGKTCISIIPGGACSILTRRTSGGKAKLFLRTESSDTQIILTRRASGGKAKRLRPRCYNSRNTNFNAMHFRGEGKTDRRWCSMGTLILHGPTTRNQCLDHPFFDPDAPPGGRQNTRVTAFSREYIRRILTRRTFGGSQNCSFFC